MKLIKYIAITLFLLPLNPVFSSGLDLTVLYGTRYIALGGAQVSLVDDAYAPFYNPAGLDQVEGGSFVLHSSNLLTQYEAPIGAPNAKRKSEWGIGPLFYLGAVYKPTERVGVGFAIYPTALQGGRFTDVNYGAGLTGKEFDLKAMRIEFAPSISLRVVKHVSLGFSYRFGYNKIKLENGVFGNPLLPGGLHLTRKFSAWDGKGFKIGAKLHDFHRFSAAVTWRFKLTRELGGNTNADLGTGPVTIPSTMQLEIPAQLQLGAHYDIIPEKWLVAFTYEYTLNNVIQDANTTFDSTPPAPFPAVFGGNIIATPLKWKNGHTIHAGTEYLFEFSNDRSLRTGVGFAFDKAVTRGNLPNPVIAPPDAYYAANLGAQYQVNSHTFGLSANYGQYGKTVTTIDPTATSILGSVFPGEYSLVAFLISADYQFKF